MAIHVDHIVPYIGEGASGPAWSVPAMCSALSQCGVQVRMHVLAPLPDRHFNFEVRDYERISFPHHALGRSPEMLQGLRKAATSADILHSHSLWMFPNIYPAEAIRGTTCRLVVSPRGTLSRWALNRSRWIKNAVMLLGQRRVLDQAACFHATAESEYLEIRSMGFRSPVAVIPNGVNVPNGNEDTSERHNARRRLLFLGRIHPTKGVDILLNAWQRLERIFPDWELRIVGPHEGEYPAQMRLLAEKLGCRRVSFPGSVHGDAKTREFLNADLFVLPTHSENFGMAVAESLAHGLPAIVTKGAPWSGLHVERCGWWIDIGVDSLTECLGDAMSRHSDELSDMGSRGRNWMLRDFSWQEIGRKMLETYEWLLNGGSQPEWVREN